jgi:hypothetical protein
LSDAQLASDVGIDPVRELAEREKYCIPVRYPSEVGIDPVREFEKSSRSCI